MNRAVPPGDRGHRSGTARRESRRGRVVPGVVRLVGGTPHPPRRKTPPRLNPAARCVRKGCESGFNGVATLSVFALGGSDRQTHLLADSPGQEPANRMRLPASRFAQFLGTNAARPLQQFEHSWRSCCRRGRNPPSFRPCALWAFSWRGPFTRLRLLRPDAGATCASAGLFGGFRLRSYASGCRFRRFYNRCHVVSLRGDYRGHDMNPSGRP